MDRYSLQMNSTPFDGTCERIEREGTSSVYEHAVLLLDAIQVFGPLRYMMALRRTVHLSGSAERLARFPSRCSNLDHVGK
jgi:hypothetical protein